MNENFQKLAFLAVVICGILISHSVNPDLFDTRHPSSMPVIKNGSTSHNEPPLIVLPSLSANITANAQGGGAIDSGSATESSSVSAVTSVLPAGAPNIGATIALVSNLNSGESIYDLRSDRRWPLASVTKLMTAVVASDLLGPDLRVGITSQMSAVDPSQPILKVGGVYTVSDLLYAMLLPSNNVAAEALAAAYGRANFLAAMNAKAAAFGMTNTYYDDPSGLSAANESTANDLLKLAQHIYADYPKVFAITRTPQVSISDVANGGTETIKSINNFAGQTDFIGGKTGYTDQADGNLLSVFSYHSEPIFIVVLGTSGSARFNDTMALYNWFKTHQK